MTFLFVEIPFENAIKLNNLKAVVYLSVDIPPLFPPFNRSPFVVPYTNNNATHVPGTCSYE